MVLTRRAHMNNRRDWQPALLDSPVAPNRYFRRGARSSPQRKVLRPRHRWCKKYSLFTPEWVIGDFDMKKPSRLCNFDHFQIKLLEALEFLRLITSSNLQLAGDAGW